jgi:2-polyprenyl-3-methyl-5-hydroxy-6-metoxy-1,4-benzoquinol methylase
VSRVDELHYRTAFSDFEPRVRQLIREHGHQRICDIGGGRSPLLWPPEVEELGVEYTLVDVSQDELDLAPAGHKTLCMDITAPLDPSNRERFDLIFSKFVAEHVPDGGAMHRNVLAMLRPGGHAFHLFPTLYHPAFVLNRLLPLHLTDRLRNAAIGRAFPKFPAHYSMCVGPSPARVAAFRAMGYEVVEYTGFYGTPYLARVPVLGRADAAVNRWLARRRVRSMTSYAYLLLRKPRPGAAPATPGPGA